MITVIILIGCLIFAGYFFKELVKDGIKKQDRRPGQPDAHDRDLWINTAYHAVSSYSDLYNGKFYKNCGYSKFNLDPAKAKKIAIAHGWTGHN